MTFDVITIFPNLFDSYLKESFIKKAQNKSLIKIRLHNLRDFTSDTRATAKGGKEDLSSLTRRRTVDDRPYGGGLGMVIKIEPIYRCVQFLKSKIKNQKSKIILFTPRGKRFTQQMAYKFSKLNQLILICGRYEGVDERVAKYIADMELSIGPYDLMGGELPAMVVIETVSRLIPGVLGKPALLKERITKEKGFIEYPQYTRPELFSPPPSPRLRPSADEVAFGRRSRRAGKKGAKWKIPKVLVSGNHKEIEKWRKKYGKVISS